MKIVKTKASSSYEIRKIVKELKKNGITDEELRDNGILVRGYWLKKEHVIAEAKKYSKPSDWCKKSSRSYTIARKKGWYKECTAHMKLKIIWNKKMCILEARKYKSRKEWAKNGLGSYSKAFVNGWIEECCKHMKRSRVFKGYWTKKTCSIEAKKYKHRKEWGDSHPSSYQAASTNGWIDFCCKHMEVIKKPNGYWNNKQNCIKEARKYKTISEWIRSSWSSHEFAQNNGWKKECTAHMEVTQKPSGFWNKENVFIYAKKCKNKGDFRKKYASAYRSAIKNKWLYSLIFKG